MSWLREAMGWLKTECRPATTEVGGKTYWTDSHGLVDAPGYPEPLKLHTLQSICDFIGEELTKLKPAATEGEVAWEPDPPFSIHIESPRVISIIGRNDQYMHRSCFAKAEYEDLAFQFGYLMPLEEFHVRLLSEFKETEDQKKMLATLRNVVDTEQVVLEDDGFTQKATVSTGVQMKETINLPPFPVLAPIRSFPEIEQVSAPFLLRVKSGKAQQMTPKAMLVETDGGAWKLEAIARIRKWLNEELPDVPIYA